MKLLYVQLALILCAFAHEIAADGTLEFIDQWQRIIHGLRTNPELQRELEEANLDNTPGVDLPSIPFPCKHEPPSSPTPTTVHLLRPSDVKVVAALGDSITAGNGVRAYSVLETFAVPNRGESWSIGGDKRLEDDVITLPNILRKYDHELKGYSTCRRQRSHPAAWFNVAVPGDISRGMNAQAEELIEKMQNDPRVDFYNDWKVISIFIGGNDLCQGCRFWERFNPNEYQKGIKAALDTLQARVPRAYVNLQPMLDVSMVPDLRFNNTPALCDFLHEITCPCAMNETSRANLRQTQMDYFYKLEELANVRTYHYREDFTVVLQPHLRDQKPFTNPDGTYDMSYIAPDCFHPSHKSHQSFAFMLWNMMLTPHLSKPYEYDERDYPTYRCPNATHPYFYTHCNSPGAYPDYCPRGSFP